MQIEHLFMRAKSGSLTVMLYQKVDPKAAVIAKQPPTDKLQILVAFRVWSSKSEVQIAEKQATKYL